MNWTSVKVVPGRIGGNSPSAGSLARTAKKLKPAAYDPDSVDIDNDGWHQEGTTAQWFGLGRNNILFQTVQRAFRNEGGGKLSDSVKRQFAELELRHNAPPIELSDEDVDVSFITGVLSSANPDAQEFSDATIASAKRFLQYRRERREGMGKRREAAEDIDIPITPDSDGSMKGTIKRFVEARKRRRAERESHFQQDIDRMIDEDTRNLAEDYKKKFMTDVDYSLESFDEIYQRVQADYAKEKRRPRVEHWENSPEILDWEAKNPRPTPQMYNDSTELRDAILEWTDERSDKLWELSRPEYNAWIDEVKRRADEEYKRIHGELPGENSPTSVEEDRLLTELFTFSAVGRDGQIYNFQVDTIVDDYGQKLVTGSIYGKDGVFVGNFERSFKPEAREIHHDHLILKEEFQSLGLASIFNARNERVYKLMGYDFITLAGLSNEKEYKGATHWPKNGFDWAEEWERDKFLGRMRSFLEYYERTKGNPPDPNKVVTIFLTKKMPDGSEQEIQVPLFASQEEYEMIKKMVDMAESQAFDDPNRLTADDLVQFQGAEEAFKLWKTTINYIRYI